MITMLQTHEKLHEKYIDSKYIFNKKLSFIFIQFFLLSIIVIPHFIYVTLQLSSFAPGIVIVLSSCILFLLILFHRYGVHYPKTYLNGVLILVFYLLFQSAQSFFLYGISKAFFSFLIILFYAFSLHYLRAILAEASVKSLTQHLRITCCFLVILGLMELCFGFRGLNYSFLDKPVFPFREHSHYALFLGPLVLALGVVSNFFLRLTLSSCLLGFALTFPNLTMLAFFVISIILFFLDSVKKILVFAFILTILLFSFLNFTHFDLYSNFYYFTSRLSLDADSTNLTTLVFLQGISDIKRYLLTTNFWGSGFQTMGVLGPSEISDKIFFLANTHLNLKDGGFLAAKIISELGITGLSLVFYYTSFIVIYFFKYLKTSIQKEKMFFSYLVGFSVEMFLRGYGYFSPSFFLALVMWFSLTFYRSHKITYCYLLIQLDAGKLDRSLEEIKPENSALIPLFKKLS